MCAAVWNGSACSNALLLEDDAKASGDKGSSATYETVSGEHVVA